MQIHPEKWLSKPDFFSHMRCRVPSYLLFPAKLSLELKRAGFAPSHARAIHPTFTTCWISPCSIQDLSSLVVFCFDICLPLSLISFADRHFPWVWRRCLIDFFFFKTNYYLVVRKLSLWPARVRDTVPNIPMQTAKSHSALSDLLYSALYTLIT